MTSEPAQPDPRVRADPTLRVTRDARRMRRAELQGRHSYATETGVVVHIYERDGSYLARGSLGGRRFGEDLGPDPERASAQLRRILTQIEDTTYVRPSERRRNPIRPVVDARATIRQVVATYIQRALRRDGKGTARRYENWLLHVLAYAEQPAVLRRYPHARDIDAQFCQDLRTFLFQRDVARNGRAGAVHKPMAFSGIRQTLQTFRSALEYAGRLEVALLPANFNCPIDADLIGRPAMKDPLRPLALPWPERVRLVQLMDLWQLLHLGPLLILPVRPDDFCGLLINEVDFATGLMRFPLRFEERDGSKRRIPFAVPFPPALKPVLQAAIARRTDGPVLRKRCVYEGVVPRLVVSQPGDLQRHIHTSLAAQKPATADDAKRVCRAVIQRAGGTDPGELYRNFKRLVRVAGLESNVTLYDCRRAGSTEFEQVNAPMLARRYLTGHSTNDIMAQYTSFTPEDLNRAAAQHWAFAAPLIDAIAHRAGEFGLSETT